jgi:deazaflavin-dependent oxidoreductase (nitroreductase family)
MSHSFRRNLSRRFIDALSTAGIKRGIGPSQRYLLTVVGRKTHTAHTTPVSLVTDGSARYLVGPYGEVGWVRNARAAGIVTLARGDTSERFSIVPLPAADAGPILRRYLKLEPITRTFFDAAADAPAEAFEAEAATHPVFRLTPVTW